ncbi:MAG: hydroxyacylglutathione hydrolase [Coxiellaceae bacterium]|nr:hydroxyacylglutathione hydrolase [Coxiellaceae bacterium]
MLQIYPVCAFKDNYIWIIHNQHYAAVVDPGDAKPVMHYLESKKLQLIAILNTHYHKDHIGGNAILLENSLVPVYGSGNEPIPTLTHPVKDGGKIFLEKLSLNFSVLDIAGHTAGHIAYYGAANGAPILFCGDTLFACGCGRIFEGTAQQMYTSLQKLANLPDETLVYSAHEYTLSNISFARTVEPGNSALSAFEKKAKELRKQDIPTLPSSITTEKATNPFLRCHHPDVISSACSYANKTLSDPVDIFTELRNWKDIF